MLKAIQTKMRDDKGFTLIELMVVVLIIAILIAIAIPTFLGLRRRAQDRAAQSNLRNAITAAKAHFTDAETYVGFNAAIGTATEPSLAWVDNDGPTAGGRQVAVSTGEITATYVKLGALSASGSFFCIQESAGVNGFGSGTTWLLAEADCGDADWATP